MIDFNLISIILMGAVFVIGVVIFVLYLTGKLTAKKKTALIAGASVGTLAAIVLQFVNFFKKKEIEDANAKKTVENNLVDISTNKKTIEEAKDQIKENIDTIAKIYADTTPAPSTDLEKKIETSINTTPAKTDIIDKIDSQVKENTDLSDELAKRLAQ